MVQFEHSRMLSAYHVGPPVLSFDVSKKLFSMRMLFGARKPADEFEFARSFAKLTTIVSHILKIELRTVMSSAGSTCRHSVWSAVVHRAKFCQVVPSIRIPCARFTCVYADCTSGCAEPRPDRHW